jgi:hypothetical protein
LNRKSTVLEHFKAKQCPSAEKTRERALKAFIENIISSIDPAGYAKPTTRWIFSIPDGLPANSLTEVKEALRALRYVVHVNQVMDGERRAQDTYELEVRC